jgi:hypothetical protein
LIVVGPTQTCTSDFGAKGVPEGAGVSVIARDGCKVRTNKEDEQSRRVGFLMMGQANLMRWMGSSGLIAMGGLAKRMRLAPESNAMLRFFIASR